MGNNEPGLEPLLSAAKPARAKRVGPFSRPETLSRLDRRTKAGRVMRSVEADLTSDLGGDPSTAERLLIQAAAVKATRVSLLSERLLEGEEPGEDGHHALSWLNSLRLDLVALGLQRRARDIPNAPVRAADHFAKPFMRRRNEEAPHHAVCA